MKTRRDFLHGTAVGATAATGVPKLLSGAMGAADAAHRAGDERPLAGDSRLRLDTSTRRVSARHRNLFNGDTCVFFYNPEKWQPEGGPYSAKAIHRYVDGLGDNGIDTFVINATAS